MYEAAQIEYMLHKLEQFRSLYGALKIVLAGPSERFLLREVLGNLCTQDRTLGVPWMIVHQQTWEADGTLRPHHVQEAEVLKNKGLPSIYLGAGMWGLVAESGRIHVLPTKEPTS